MAKLKKITKKALKQAVKEIRDDRKSYHDAYSFWFSRILNLTNPPFPGTLKEYMTWQDEYDFCVRITMYYAAKFKELDKQEKELETL